MIMLGATVSRADEGSGTQVSSLIAQAQAPVSLSILLHAKDFDQESLIKNIISAPFILDGITFNSDVYLSAYEFAYLVDLSPGSLVTPEQLATAASYLFKKNKFEKIGITLSSGPKGYHVNFALTGFWTLKKLKFKGAMIGKERYRSCYLIESGDAFDESKHQKSLDNMRTVFKNEGYFNAQVDTVCSYNQKTKQVVVYCALKRNERFSINSAHLEIKSDNSMNAAQRDELVGVVRKIFIKRVDHGSYNQASINSHIQRLQKDLARKGFIYVTIDMQQKVHHETHKIDLTFTLDVHHKKEFIFTGNKFFSQEKLLDLMLEFGHSAWLLPASIFAQEIKQAYQKKGFWDAHIESIEEPDSYRFVIDEGPRIIIKKIMIKNVNNEKVFQGALDCFADVISSKHYDEELLGSALDDLGQWYHKQGFLDVKILKKDFIPIEHEAYESVSIDTTADHLLELTIEQGPRSYLTSISIECFKELEASGPFASIQKENLHIPFDAQLLQDQRQWLLDHFRKKGYLQVEAKPDIIRNDGQVTVKWKINRGQEKTKFGKTILVGSNTFPFQYVQREVAYKQGEVWNQDAIKKSFSNLKRLDIFEHIHFSPDQITKEEPEKAVILKLQEDERFEIKARAGLELLEFTRAFLLEGFAYRVGGTFIVKNPCNLGDRLTIDGDVARGYRKALANYQLPWIGSQRVKTEFILFSDQYLQPGFIGCTKNIYELMQHGGMIGFSRKFNYFDTGLNIGFEWMQTKIPDKSDGMRRQIESIARAIDFNPLLLDRQVPYFRIEPTIMIDLLDQKINPTHGGFTVLSAKGLFPLNRPQINSVMIKALVEQSLFASIKSVVLALRLRCGHIFQTQFNSIMPSERFYLGGANSIRSYDTDFAPPLGSFVKDTDGKDKDCVCFVPQGGKSMVNVNAEIRFPLFKQLGGVLFQDLGALSSNRFADFNTRSILAGTGAGIRVATPVGPLRFDIAWKWTKMPSTIRSYAWFLTFGQAF